MAKNSKNPYLQHGWGKTAEQKRKEQEYNRRYYEQHKRDKWGVGVGGNSRGSGLSNIARNFQDNFNTGMDMITGQSRRLARQEAESASRLANHRMASGTARNERMKQQNADRNRRYRNASNAYAQNEMARSINQPGSDVLAAVRQQKADAKARRAGVAANYAANAQDSYNAARKRAAGQNRSNAYAQNEMARQNAARSQYENTRTNLNSQNRSNAYAQNEMARQNSARSQYENTRTNLNSQNRSNAYAENEMARRTNQGNSDVLAAVRRQKELDAREARDAGPSAVLDAVKAKKSENKGRTDYLSGKRSNAYAQNEMARQNAARSQYENTRTNLNSQNRSNAYAENEMARNVNNPSELTPQIREQKIDNKMNSYAKNIAKMNKTIDDMNEQYKKQNETITRLEKLYPDTFGSRSPLIQKRIDDLKEEHTKMALEISEQKKLRNKAQSELEALKRTR